MAQELVSIRELVTDVLIVKIGAYVTFLILNEYYYYYYY